MSSDSTTEVRWPLLRERAPAPFATPSLGGARRRRLPRSAWLLTGLAFLCGGLVSAAAFSIGWRHQAQRDTAARTALAAATARTHKLEQKIAGLQDSLSAARASAAAASASKHALARAGAKVGGEATASNRKAGSVSSAAASLGGSATRIASELKTLETYLTTTPTSQLDPGYIASQTAFLEERLTRLQDDAGGLGSSVASFKAALRKLSRDAATLKAR
jgi:chromosome segregation ATPase